MADDSIYINRPTAKAYDVPYEPPPPGANPVLRGLPLSIAATIISKTPFLQRFLWSNAGFGKVHDIPELEHIEPRYDPTVIKTSRSNITGTVRSNDEFLASLSAEDWSSKRPFKSVYFSSLDYHEAYKSGRLTPTQVVETLLPLIRRDVEGAEHSVAFLSVKADLVKKAAEESTERYRAGKWRSPIDGIPMAVKDEEDLTAHPKSLGSRLSYTHPSDATSHAVRLWLSAGALCLGKTTMHELGLDTTNCNPVHGTPRNPHNPHYYCGGSSGGSAYAVASGIVPLAMGNDGGGSVRIPAAFCGVYGLKTSQGRVGIGPTANLARSNGVAGPIGGCMVDVELGYRVMAQPDPNDSMSAMWTPPAPTPMSADGNKKVLGIFRPWFDRADPEVHSLCTTALEHLTKTLDYEFIEITLPHLPHGQLAHALTILSEIATGVPRSTLPSLTAPNKILLSLGHTTPGVSFLQAQRLREVIMRHLSALWEEHPGMILITPTTPNAGWRINEADLGYGCSDGDKSIRNMEYAWLANFSGCPSISVPVGTVEAEGGAVPVGLMGMGEWGDEEGLIGWGYEMERYINEVKEGGRAKPGNFVDAVWAETVG
ncbi:uncharacterized protein LTR77_004145 [Saxophila tyrrhenica]|uniref:Amidase domain-containing protein n=1 Tax=Saxophila tyrrhenica TaxID=1690608 RepID=A0AAV9PCC5_9PEZI|nr:hypothetical protein LTR77_004145 [Saxophila tyrrhenica]